MTQSSPLSDYERERLLAFGRGPAHPLPSQLVPEQVLMSAARFPDATAAEMGQRRLSYGELVASAWHLAEQLTEIGAERGSVVGVCMQRGVDMAVAVLGVMLSGATYLPLDPAYPTARLSFMVSDSRAVAVACSPEQASLVASWGVPAVVVTSCGPPAARPATISLKPDDLAYIIYTSGSTGTPKGVMVEHRGLANLVPVVADVFQLAPGARVLQFASLSFDASVTEVLAPLASGATVVMVPQEVVSSGLELLKAIDSFGITVATLPPSLLAALPDAALPQLSVLCSAGEACPPEVARRWGRGRRFVNGYGPTEATVAAAYHVMDAGQAEPIEGPYVPVGGPIANTEAYVLGPDLQLVPLGANGELCLGGPNLARGYLGRPELTNERFISHPFSPGQRLYRTGDSARWRPDGTLEVLGRLDQQVKLRGYRIELGEVEHALASHPKVASATAVVRDDGAVGPRLVAYVVPKPEHMGQNWPSPAELREHAASSLPAFMVPGAVVVLDALPTTPNGKVDRAALPDPRATAATTSEAPGTPIELVVGDIWQEVLGLGAIGLDDDLLALGTDSLIATKALARLRGNLGIELPLTAVFENPTVRGLSRLVLAALAISNEAELALALAEIEPPD